MANKYEMHVYTMGTRAYAEEVCAAIDPESKIFGGRILSRDESGSECRSFGSASCMNLILWNLSRFDSEEPSEIVPL